MELMTKKDEKEEGLFTSILLPEKDPPARQKEEIAQLKAELSSLKTMNKKLEDNNNLINSLFQSSQDAIAALDSEFIFLAFNKSFISTFQQIFAVEVEIGMNFSSLLTNIPLFKTRILNACYQAQAGINSSILIENTMNNGAYYCYELNISSAFNTHTKKKELNLNLKNLSTYKLQELQSRKQQAEIERVARTNVMGELISALAHEINQPLTAIKAYSQGCLLKIKRDNNFQTLVFPLMQIANQSEHAGNILHRMKDFMRDGTIYLEKTDLNSLIRQTLSFLYYEFANFKLMINLELFDDLPVLLLDRIKIMQVVLNLGRNSIEALQNAHSKKPTITIATTLIADYVIIHFRDNGPGIPPHLRDKILSSYFTTKAQGTGLGLSICKTLINAHGGALFSNESDNGAWFSFTLPLQRANDGNH